MNTDAHDFVHVDLRGLKPALAARAKADRLSVSALVRAAVTHHLGLDNRQQCADVGADGINNATVKLSIRMTAGEGSQLHDAARRAGLSRGALIVGLLDGVPALTGAATRGDHITALSESSAAVATLARDIHHLTALLREGAFRAAQEYRPVLETLDGDLRQHLRLAAATLAALGPTRGSTPRPHRALPENRGGVHAEPAEH